MNQQFPGHDAIAGLDANIGRLDTFVNKDEAYTSTDGAQVESVRQLSARLTALVESTGVQLGDLLNMTTEQIDQLIASSNNEINEFIEQSEEQVAQMINELRIHNKGDWQPNTAYIVNDIVKGAGAYFLCLQSHTSSASFDADYSAGMWLPYSTSTSIVTADAPGLMPGWSSSGLGAIPFVDINGIVYGSKLPVASTVANLVNGKSTQSNRLEVATPEQFKMAVNQLATAAATPVQSGAGWFQIGKFLFCYGSGYVSTSTAASYAVTFAKAFSGAPAILSSMGLYSSNLSGAWATMISNNAQRFLQSSSHFLFYGAPISSITSAGLVYVLNPLSGSTPASNFGYNYLVFGTALGA